MIPKVSIIVLNYNGLTFLKQCIPSIKKQTYKNIEIVVADNHSTDGSIEYLSTIPSIRIVRNKQNYGYAKANNIAANHAKGTFLLFLNNDTKLDKDAIWQLVACYKDNSILSACQILPHLKKNKELSGCGVDIFGYPYLEDNSKKTNIFFVDGATFFIKKEDFIKIGGFDEELFIFEEDIDLCWRAQMMKYKILPCWDAKIIHYSGGTIAGGSEKNNTYTSSYFRRYLNEKNIVRNILKNYSTLVLPFILIPIMLIHLTEVIALLILLKWKVAECYFHAYYWNITHLKNTLRMRKKIQGKRRVSDFEIMKKMYFAYSKLTAFRRVGFPRFTSL